MKKLCQGCHTFQELRQCRGCDKERCEGCLAVWHCDPFSRDDRYRGPLLVCHSCSALITPYVEKSVNIKMAFDDTLFDMLTEWRKKCRTR